MHKKEKNINTIIEGDNMKDTIKLLQECDAGSKMAVSSIDEVLEKVTDKELEKILSRTKKEHSKIGNDIHELLNDYEEEEKEPNPIAKSMSWMKTNFKVGMDDSTSTIADIMIDGCDMGIKSLYQYLHKYNDANENAKDICNDLIDIEEELREDLQKYL